MMSKFVKTIPQTNLYTEYLRSLNGLLRLTDKELEILAKIIELNPNPVNDEFENVVSLQVRRRIIFATKVNKANLSKHIGNFIKRKYLIKDHVTGSVKINKALIPQISNGEVQISIIIRLEDENNSSK